MQIITTFSTRHQAEEVLLAMAGELAARFDPLLRQWRYTRDGHERSLWLNRDVEGWQLCIEGKTVELAGLP